MMMIIGVAPGLTGAMASIEDGKVTAVRDVPSPCGRGSMVRDSRWTLPRRVAELNLALRRLEKFLDGYQVEEMSHESNG